MVTIINSYKHDFRKLKRQIPNEISFWNVRVYKSVLFHRIYSVCILLSQLLLKTVEMVGSKL